MLEKCAGTWWTAEKSLRQPEHHRWTGFVKDFVRFYRAPSSLLAVYPKKGISPRLDLAGRGRDLEEISVQKKKDVSACIEQRFWWIRSVDRLFCCAGICPPCNSLLENQSENAVQYESMSALSCLWRYDKWRTYFYDINFYMLLDLDTSAQSMKLMKSSFPQIIHLSD